MLIKVTQLSSGTNFSEFPGSHVNEAATEVLVGADAPVPLHASGFALSAPPSRFRHAYRRDVDDGVALHDLCSNNGAGTSWFRREL